MRTIALAVALLITFPATVRAQASVDIRVNLPLVLPRLVVVSPGIEVVPEVDEEVFFVDGFYWVRRPHGWYRSKSHRGGWMAVPARVVPARIVKLPPGKYRRFRPQPASHHVADRDHRGDRHRDHRRDHRGHGRDDHRGGHGHEKGHGGHGKR